MNVINSLHISLVLLLAIGYGEAIVNGRNAQPQRFPYMASLRHLARKHQCGVAIIHEKYGLTAGHCVYGKKEEDHVIQYGSVSLVDPDIMTRIIKKFHLHQNYVPPQYKNSSALAAESQSDPDLDYMLRFCGAKYMETPMQNDIAIIELFEAFADPLTWFNSEQGSISGKTYHVAKIDLSKEFPGACAMCSFAGWGKVSFARTEKCSDDLKYVYISIHDKNDCEREYCGDYDNVFCAQHFPRIASIERGDSGGPLICNGLLTGVVSFVDLGEGAPAYFVDVTKFRGFIDPFVKSPENANNSKKV